MGCSSLSGFSYRNPPVKSAPSFLIRTGSPTCKIARRVFRGRIRVTAGICSCGHQKFLGRVLGRSRGSASTLVAYSNVSWENLGTTTVSSLSIIRFFFILVSCTIIYLLDKNVINLNDLEISGSLRASWL